MQEDQPAKTPKLRAIGAALAIIAIAAGGAVWSGCGSDDGTSSTSGGTGTDSAQEKIEGGVETAEQGIEEGSDKAKKGIEEAQDKFEEGKGDAKKSLEEAKEKAEELLP